MVSAAAVYMRRGPLAGNLFFFSSRRRHTRCLSDWSSDVCSSDLHIERKDKRQGEGEDTTTARLVEVAKALPWDGPDHPGPWQPVTRRFRDGGTATWWAAEASFGEWGPDEAVPLVVATAESRPLPPHKTRVPL